MFKTLYGSLAAVLLGLFCLIGVSVILLSLYTTRTYVQDVNQKLNRSLAEHMVAEKILMQAGRVNEEAWQRSKHYRLARKLPGTIASKAGVRSASGPASRSVS